MKGLRETIAPATSATYAIANKNVPSEKRNMAVVYHERTGQKCGTNMQFGLSSCFAATIVHVERLHLRADDTSRLHSVWLHWLCRGEFCAGSQFYNRRCLLRNGLANTDHLHGTCHPSETPGLKANYPHNRFFRTNRFRHSVRRTMDPPSKFDRQSRPDRLAKLLPSMQSARSDLLSDLVQVGACFPTVSRVHRPNVNKGNWMVPTCIPIFS